jgi:GNAT superfamily N-acetyltransferase
MTPLSEPTDALAPLTACGPALTAQAREIYESAFPAAVRAPFADLVAVAPTERTQVLLDHGGVLGLFLVRDLADTGWSFLRYFVVAAESRGQGAGGRLWRALCRDLAARGQTRLLFDVEDPDEATVEPTETAIRVSRVRFYRRLGADLVDVTDYAPPAHGEPGTDPVPLRLLGAVVDSSGETSPLPPDPAAVGDLVDAVMRHRYGIDPGDTPRASFI